MNCPNCGAPLEPGEQFCSSCGAKVQIAQPAPPTYTVNPGVNAGVSPVVSTGAYSTVNSLPPQYRPLSAWAYFGYSLLFAIPFAGFILLIVFSCNSSNINRRNFARSYWCLLIVVAVAAGILALTGGLSGLLSGAFK